MMQIGHKYRLKRQEGIFELVGMNLLANRLILKNIKTETFAHVGFEDIESEVEEDQWKALRTMGE